MSSLALIGGGFLLAVLCFDLMFDVQIIGHREPELPESVLSSIAGYYRRVTVDAFPMNQVVAVAMLLTIVGVVGSLFGGSVPLGSGLLSLAFGAVPAGLGLARVVPNAMRLGQRGDDVATQSRLARSILNDHLLCFAALVLFVTLRWYITP